ncbi:MAG: DnaD domain protein [Oscillospiraceae bacterium]
MPEKRFVLPAPETVAIQGEAAEKLISCGNGCAALLYIYILKNRGAFSEEEAAASLHWTPAAVVGAAQTLVSLGLVSGDEGAAGNKTALKIQPRDELPEYTADDISRVMKNGGSFPGLVSEVQRRLGKVLSSDDLLKLLGIYDSLGLPPEVILILVSYCMEETRKKYGCGRLPTMRYIEKVAYTWEHEGIFSIEEAEEYLKRMEARKSAASEISAVLQIKGRELSKTERSYVDDWLQMGFSPEVVEAAYDKTVIKTGKLAWGYLNSILKSWHEKGIHAISDIEAREKSAPRCAENTSGYQAPAGTEIERLKKLLKSIEEE